MGQRTSSPLSAGSGTILGMRRTTAVVFVTVLVLLRVAAILLLLALAAVLLVFTVTMRMTRHVMSGL
jgi:hypothetical protein